jgi:hypothetical protein
MMWISFIPRCQQQLQSSEQQAHGLLISFVPLTPPHPLMTRNEKLIFHNRQISTTIPSSVLPQLDNRNSGCIYILTQQQHPRPIQLITLIGNYRLRRNLTSHGFLISDTSSIWQSLCLLHVFCALLPCCFEGGCPGQRFSKAKRKIGKKRKRNKQPDDLEKA